jgi:hypothetical protein
LIESKLVHMFIHCNSWLVSLFHADNLSVNFVYDWIVSPFPCEKLLFILIEITTYFWIWNYNCYKRTVSIYSIWISNMCICHLTLSETNCLSIPLACRTKTRASSISSKSIFDKNRRAFVIFSITRSTLVWPHLR